jgi:prepilin-type N-terminal cleavage/methylation domain-containing protein
MRKTQRGFTLVELMVVVAILAILAGLLAGVSNRTYGASSNVVADQIASTMGWVKMRAVSTRRIQKVYIRPNEILIWQSDVTGFAASPNNPGVEFVQRVSLPRNVAIWNAEATIYTAAGTTVTENTTLDYELQFKPDGSSTGGTIFLTDKSGPRRYRILVYRATGGSYARETW